MYANSAFLSFCFFPPGVNAEPCWQPQSVNPPDGRLCILIDDEINPGRKTWYFGRTALDLSIPNQKADNIKHFCAYEALINDHNAIKRSRLYFWLDANEDDLRSRLQKEREHTNDSGVALISLINGCLIHAQQLICLTSAPVKSMRTPERVMSKCVSVHCLTKALVSED